MKAITIREPGGPQVLEWAEVPDPRPGPSEVVIDVAASAVNRADLLQREGHYPPPAGAPPYPGLECSGAVSAVGPGVTEWSVGDPVCALLPGGGYAEQVAVSESLLLPVPDGVGLVDAAGLPEAACTVWSNVVMLAELGAGDTFLVHGGGGGVGTMAIQVAAALGTRVLCTVGSPAKAERCLGLGADVAIDYTREDFVARVHEETGGHGADVILDVIGAAYLERNVEALATNGRLVVIGLQGGRRGELDLGRLLAKRAAVLATTLRSRPLDERATIVASVRENLWPLVEAGDIRPVTDRVLPLRDAAEAHRVVGAGEHVGKVVLAR